MAIRKTIMAAVAACGLASFALGGSVLPAAAWYGHHHHHHHCHCWWHNGHKYCKCHHHHHHYVPKTY